MLTPVILTIIVIVALILALSGLSEIAYQLFGKGKRLRLAIHSDDAFKKELNFEGGERLLSILQNKGFHIPSGCGGNATCGQCKVKLLSDMGPHTPTETPLFDSVARKEAQAFLEDGKGDGYTRLSCQVRVDKDIEVYLPKSTLHVKKYTARVVKKIPLTSDKYETHLRPFKKFNFVPGQYIQIRLPDDYAEEHYKKFGTQIECYCKEIGRGFVPYTPGMDIYRAYSIATTQKETLRLITRIASINPHVPIEEGGVPCVGPGCIKNYLQDKSILNLWVGDRIQFTGPFGNFHLKDDKHSAVFVAGGAGLAPILALMEQWFNEERSEKVFLFLGERRFQDIPLPYISRWLNREKKYPNFEFIPVLSGAFKGDDPAEMNSIDKVSFSHASEELKRDILREGLIDKSGEKWLGKKGFIGPLLTDYVPPGPGTTFYLCGPAPMTVTVIDAAAGNLGVLKNNVLFDDFTGTLTPSLDLIYHKLELIHKIEALNLVSIDEYIKKIGLVLVIKLILRDKIDDGYAFLDMVENIVENDVGTKEAALESLLREYD